MMKTEALRRRERRQTFMTVLFTVISVLYLMPVVLVLINSLKANAFVNTETFKLPTAESFVGLKNYVKGMTFGNFAFYKVVFYSFFITIASTRRGTSPVWEVWSVRSCTTCAYSPWWCRSRWSCTRWPGRRTSCI